MTVCIPTIPAEGAGILPRTPLAVGDGPPPTGPVDNGTTTGSQTSDTYYDRLTGVHWTYNDDTGEWETDESPGLVLTNMAWNEVPSGDIDGVNAIFQTAQTPIGMILSKNGMIQQPGSGNDYVLVVSSITFEPTNLPVIGDVILATYSYL